MDEMKDTISKEEELLGFGTMGKDGSIILPEAVIKEYDLQKGDILIMKQEEDRLVLEKNNNFKEVVLPTELYEELVTMAEQMDTTPEQLVFDFLNRELQVSKNTKVCFNETPKKERME